MSRQNSSVAHASAYPFHHPVATQYLCRNTRPPGLDHILSRHHPRLQHITKRTLSRGPKSPSPSPKPNRDTKVLSRHVTESLCRTHPSRVMRLAWQALLRHGSLCCDTRPKGPYHDRGLKMGSSPLVLLHLQFSPFSFPFQNTMNSM